MASSLRKPEPLKFDGNVAENLRVFILDFDVYLRAAHPNAKEETKIGIFLNLAGLEAIERSQSFVFGEEEDQGKIDTWKVKFRELCEPMKNLTIIRHDFYTTQQGEETFHAYLTKLRAKADACQFGNMRDDMLKDRIVVGVKCDKTRDLLFAEPNLELQRAIEICELREGAEKAVRALKKEDQEKEVCVIGQHRHRNKGKAGQCRRCGSDHDRNNCPGRHSRAQGKGDDHDEEEECHYCGYKHKKYDCPAYGKICSICGRKNHFAKVCMTGRRQDRENSSKNVHIVEYESEEETEAPRNYIIE